MKPDKDKEVLVKGLKWILLAIGLVFVISLTLVILKGIQQESQKQKEQSDFEGQSIEDVRSAVRREKR